MIAYKGFAPAPISASLREIFRNNGLPCIQRNRRLRERLVHREQPEPVGGLAKG
jgi:hypothetical protein